MRGRYSGSDMLRVVPEIRVDEVLIDQRRFRFAYHTPSQKHAHRRVNSHRDKETETETETDRETERQRVSLQLPTCSLWERSGDEPKPRLHREDRTGRPIEGCHGHLAALHKILNVDLVLIAVVMTVLAPARLNELLHASLVACTGAVMPPVLDSRKSRDRTEIRGYVAFEAELIPKLGRQEPVVTTGWNAVHLVVGAHRPAKAAE